MDKNTERLFEINKRKAEIRSLIEENKAENLDEIEAELRSLDTEYANIEQRMKLIDGIVVKKPEGDKSMETREFTIESAEYRSAFLNKLRGVELNEAEKRAFTTAVGSAEAVIPTITQNKIVEVIKQHAPLLAEINLLQVPGGVRVPVEDVVDAAITHAENATITASGDTLTYVDLFGYEVTKLLQISKSVMKMSVDAFETWLANNLGKSLASKITFLIISGTGSGEAEGIDEITWDATNSVTVALAGSLTNTNVTTLIGLLAGGYDANAKFLMSKKTLFTDFMPLKDASKNDLVTREGSNYFIYGYPVMLDERITLHEAILGDFMAGYYGNMPEDVNVTTAFDIDTNSYKYLGAGMFDGKVALTGAFVKLIKATA
ncbi:phage major capsid protein [Sinanaerobacter chloroacetimidivorans]|uniref:Phage major capsid protein n=1 Tax=Sinanaerobacter chloroacetimidivorans TaxID=2818044 RepID=A0A8J7W4P0_9FIRM|nr:phage major capsid protein [Sinanaerobacter chloroacetimidivorans]MBR0599043.1 phage major capsid protein [Sinanaerobacter chloroacetimidivorans]